MFYSRKIGSNRAFFRGKSCRICPVFCAVMCKNEVLQSQFRVKMARARWPPRNRSRHTGCPVKNDDFGGVFNPLAGKLFSVTKFISRNGKHSLLSPETYHVPGTQKRVEYPVPFPLVRRPAQRDEPSVPETDFGNKTGQNGWARKARPSKK